MALATFDPNAITPANGRFFGFPYPVEAANVILLPVPWDVTTSYTEGAAAGPQAILDASCQLDWYDFAVPRAWEIGHGSLPISAEILQKNQHYRQLAKQIITALEQGADANDTELQQLLAQVNRGTAALNQWVYEQVTPLLEQGKLIGLVGGDHSVPLGFLRALAAHHTRFGILQIDAHADLRRAYEGFTDSHASIMYNALQLNAVSHLVQVGIRDVCEAEMTLAQQDLRIIQFTDPQLKANAYEGMIWSVQTEQIVAKLPQQVYISFDIDGLDPALCPHTGTPVPGGLDFNQALYLLESLVKAGKTIIGFDLCEVAPGQTGNWDGNVGARLLYRLGNLMYASHHNVTERQDTPRFSA
ncbi:agmatinase [Synechococcales cyanobacterium C]|uniref:Agmatinase n=1 Tax=Petrachloros mirabilis ULC683 TaxID=2781853 RepID=A0A8K1ZXB3_9CYAN|nr:agmatinase family protein [Petrachloros mirabilis]NCJ05802.1 agmatinase [Petrachloros mirabilis ULC683]